MLFIPKFLIISTTFIYNKEETSKTMKGGDEKKNYM